MAEEREYSYFYLDGLSKNDLDELCQFLAERGVAGGGEGDFRPVTNQETTIRKSFQGIADNLIANVIWVGLVYVVQKSGKKLLRPQIEKWIREWQARRAAQAQEKSDV